MGRSFGQLEAPHSEGGRAQCLGVLGLHRRSHSHSNRMEGRSRTPPRRTHMMAGEEANRVQELVGAEEEEEANIF